MYCSDCQVRFANPMEDPGRSFYEKSTIYRSRSARVLCIKDDWRFETCLNFLGSRTRENLLDIGCGDGAFLSLARDRGFNVFGVDLDQRAIYLARYLRNLPNVWAGGWEEVTKVKEWKDFDVITLFDVLEHVSSPASLVSTIFRLLRPSGTLCITVPRLDRCPNILDSEADYPPHHFTLWTAHSLQIILAEAGFEGVKIIEKPLMATNIASHLRWRAGRFYGNAKVNEFDSADETVANTEFVWRFFRSSLTGANLLLKISHLGRGFTLLAVAQKPSFAKS